MHLFGYIRKTQVQCPHVLRHTQLCIHSSFIPCPTINALLCTLHPIEKLDVVYIVAHTCTTNTVLMHTLTIYRPLYDVEIRSHFSALVPVSIPEAPYSGLRFASHSHSETLSIVSKPHCGFQNTIVPSLSIPHTIQTHIPSSAINNSVARARCGLLPRTTTSSGRGSPHSDRKFKFKFTSHIECVPNLMWNKRKRGRKRWVGLGQNDRMFMGCFRMRFGASLKFSHRQTPAQFPKRTSAGTA